MSALIPPRFLVRVAHPCRYIKKMPREDDDALLDLPESCRLDNARRAFDANFVRAALVRNGGRRAQAAGELGLTRQGLAKLMVRLGIADAALS